MKHYRFRRGAPDVINAKGKITEYQEINIVASTEPTLEGYVLVGCYDLGEGWQ